MSESTEGILRNREGGGGYQEIHKINQEIVRDIWGRKGGGGSKTYVKEYTK